MLHIAAFQQMGYRFTPTFVQNLLAKYDSRTRRLTLDNFIVACVQIKRLTGKYKMCNGISYDIPINNTCYSPNYVDPFLTKLKL